MIAGKCPITLSLVIDIVIVVSVGVNEAVCFLLEFFLLSITVSVHSGIRAAALEAVCLKNTERGTSVM